MPAAGFEANSGEDLAVAVSLSLVDHYGQVVSTESVASVTLRTPTSGATVVGSVVTQFDDGVATFNDQSGGPADTSAVEFGVSAPPGSAAAVLGSATVDGRVLQSAELLIALRSCAPGEFLSSSLACSLCEAGKFSNASDSAECEPCPFGYEQASAGQTSCDLCAAGSFADRTASAACTVCPKGRAAGAAGSSQCDQCEAGRFASDTNQTSCELCSAGEFAAASAT